MISARRMSAGKEDNYGCIIAKTKQSDTPLEMHHSASVRCGKYSPSVAIHSSPLLAFFLAQISSCPAIGRPYLWLVLLDRYALVSSCLSFTCKDAQLHLGHCACARCMTGHACTIEARYHCLY